MFFFPRHKWGAPALAGTQARGVSQHIRLGPAEGRGIAAHEILPSEKDGLCAYSFRGPQRVKGCDVIRLFVNVEDVRAHLLHDLGKGGVEMKVKMPVQRHRLDPERVPFGMNSFEGHNPALILPKRRDDHRQFEVGMARERFKFRLILPDDACLADH